MHFKYIIVQYIDFDIFFWIKLLTIYFSPGLLLFLKEIVPVTRMSIFFSLVCFSPPLYTFSISILFKTNWHVEQKMTRIFYIFTRRIWRYQREVIRICKSKKDRRHNGQKKKRQKDKQWSTKHGHKTKYQATQTLPKTGGELRCPGRESSSCSTSGTRGVNLVTNPVISHEWGKDWKYLHKWNISMVICDTDIP